MKRLICSLLFVLTSFFLAANEKPNSNINGVQIGVITYSYRFMPSQALPDILKYVVSSGINSVELMGFVVEEYAGIPGGQTLRPFRAKDKGNKEEEKKYNDLKLAQKKWRQTVSMDKFKEIRNMFDNAGVRIDILKMGFPEFWSDEEFDYAFRVAKILGAKGLSMEISEETAKRMAPLAEKYDMFVILHNHKQPGDPNFSFDKILSYGNKLMLNFDVGHYVKSTGKNPVNILSKYHNRIFSIHLKDKTDPDKSYGEPDLPFGQGDTPLSQVLLSIMNNKWNILCHIEIEYRPENNSDQVKEVIKSLEYCREILNKN